MPPPVSLRTLPDALPPPGRPDADVAVHDHPVLVTDGPAPQVTIVLSDEPPPGSTRIRQLVTGARVDLRFRLAPTPDELAATADTVPVWPASRSLVLLDGPGRLADATVDRGNALRISSRLRRGAALRLLDAVFGTDRQLLLVGGVTYASRAGPAHAEVAAPLHDVLAGRVRTDHVRLVVDRDGELEPVARRVVHRASRRGSRGLAGSTILLHRPATTTSVAAALQPSPSRPAASAVFTSLPASALATHAVLDDLVLERPREPLPRVEDVDAPLWPDLHDDDVRWHAPEYAAIPPGPGDDLDTGPFAFRFRRIGVTATGEPGLDGEIRLRLAPRPSPATTAALEAAGEVEVRAVDATGITARLLIPFVDAATGETGQHPISADVTSEDDGTLTVRAAVRGDWVRLAYGSLVQEGFQRRPVETEVAYHFRAAVPHDGDAPAGGFGGKTAGVAIGRDASAVSTAPLLDRTDLTLHARGRRVATFTPEPARSATTTSGAGVVRPLQEGAMTVRPTVTAVAVPERIGRRSIARRSRAELLVPCSEHGHLYVDETDEPARSVGCEDALRLGTTTYDLFGPLPEQGTDRFRVDRDLQHPGRYLVRPVTYRIGRREPEDPVGPYEPLMLLYAHLSSDASEPSRIVFDTTLLPDVTTAELELLLDDLRDVSPVEPDLLLPTDLDHVDVEWHWNVAVPDTDVTALLLPGGGIRVTIDTAVASWPLLRSQLETAGVAGLATIELTDGSRIDIGLELDLRHLVGPRSGPVTARREGGTATLTNHAESPMAVPEVLVVGDGTVSLLPVRQTLPAGAVEEVPVSGAGSRLVVAHQPVVSGPVPLDEVRSYVENIDTTIAFVNLVNLDNHELTRLEVEARITDLGPEQRIVLDRGNDVGECRFVLPLTRYLRDPRMEYRVTTVTAEGASTPSDWTTWDIASDGVVVSLVWEDLDGQEPG